MSDYYERLGVSKQATQAEIKKAYRKMAVKYHPDKNQGDAEAEAKFKEVSEAYDTIGDEQKRAQYDQYGHDAYTQRGGGGGGGADPFDMFSQFFGGGGGGGGSVFDSIFGGGGGGGGRRRGGPQQGDDLRYDLEVDFKDAVFGLEKELEIPKTENCDRCTGSGAEPGSKVNNCGTCGGHGEVTMSQGFFSVRQECPACHGAGKTIEKKCNKCRGEGKVRKNSKIRVKIPAGVDTGNRIRISGGGNAGVKGGPAGDLYVVVHVRDHEIFERDGMNIHCELPIQFSVAALGGSIEIPTIDGRAKLKVPAGTQSGSVFRMPGKGVPSLRGSGRGDYLVRLVVSVPKSLTGEQKEALQAYSTACGDENNPIEESFFGKAKKFFAG